jgi:hypothetical protein
MIAPIRNEHGTVNKSEIKGSKEITLNSMIVRKEAIRIK